MRDVEGPDQPQRFLCHAPDERAATAVARGLLHASPGALGYELAWIDPTTIETALRNDGRELLGLGMHRLVLDEPEWSLAQTALAAPTPLRRM
jgi:hypothetical protein